MKFFRKEIIISQNYTIPNSIIPDYYSIYSKTRDRNISTVTFQCYPIPITLILTWTRIIMQYLKNPGGF